MSGSLILALVDRLLPVNCPCSTFPFLFLSPAAAPAVVATDDGGGAAAFGCDSSMLKSPSKMAERDRERERNSSRITVHAFVEVTLYSYMYM